MNTLPETLAELERKINDNQSAFALTVTREVIKSLIADVRELADTNEKLLNPIAVWVNIVSGKIKIPEWLKDVRGLEQEHNQLKEALQNCADRLNIHVSNAPERLSMVVLNCSNKILIDAQQLLKEKE